MFRKRTFEGLSKLILLLVFCAGLVAAAPNTSAQVITYSISGHVADAGSNSIVDVSVADGAGHTASTDGSGNYTLSGLDAGTYTVTPSKIGYTFSPVSLEVIVPPDGTDQDFTAQAISYSISGNAGISGALLSYFDGVSKNVVADGNGDYSLAVSYSWSGTVTPSKADYSFSPVSKGYSNVVADEINENYTATQIEYTLTLTSAHGTVAKNPNQAAYHQGDVVQLTATPNTGWSFVNWTGALTGAANPGSVSIDGNTTVTANYTLNTYTLSVNKTGTGSSTVTSSPAGINCGSTCSSAFNYNTAVTLTAAASTGSTFTGWSGGGCSGTGTCIVTITAVATVTANFTLQTPLLTVSRTGTGNGTITSNPVGINCGSTCSHAFNYNTVVTLTATASTGSSFAGWSGGGCTGLGTCTVTMTAATMVAASFSDIVPPSVSWIAPVGDAQVYEVYNQTLQLEVNASDNVGISRVVYYRWDYINLTSVEIGTVNNSPYRLNFNTSTLLPEWNQINAEVYDTNNNLSSKYIWLKHLQMPLLTVNKIGSGKGTVTSDLAGINCGLDCSEPYAYDKVITLTPVAFAGSTFAGWSGGGCSGTGICTVTLSSPQSVTATFSVAVSAPTLQSPRTNVITNINTPTFWWMSVKGGQTYQIMFATDIAFTANVDSHTVSGPPYAVILPFGDGKYYWRVRGYNDSNQPGEWSSARTFTIDTTGPVVPVLSLPGNNTSSNRTPTFKWNSVPSAVSYQFQYDDNSNLLSPIYTVTVRGIFRRPPAMGIGTYYWHVRAKDAAGNWGAWSAPFTVTITGP